MDPSIPRQVNLLWRGSGLPTPRRRTLAFEVFEHRQLFAADTGRMAVGMNLENVVDWSPAWTFTDAFKASRPWISHAFNTQTWGTTWDAAAAPTLDLDANGNVRSLKTWTQNGVPMKQFAGTLMFNSLDGGYAGGTYRAEWDGTGVVTFGFDSIVTASGRTAAGRNFADLRVTPTDSGIYLRIEETSPADPVRNFNVWMPDWNGRSFVGERWQPGATFSPFHPLFLERLAPFTTLRFMGMQETNTSDIVTWSQVFAGQTDRIVRVAAGQAANSWIVEQIVANMAGSYDAIALAPSITFTDEQREGYTAATTLDHILADARTNLVTSLQWTRDHAELAARLATQLGRPIRLVAYEGGPHLDGRNEPYQAAFYAATNDPRMGEIYRDYLQGLDAAGLDLYVDFQFTGQAGAAPWGDFAKLHRMHEPLAAAGNYNAVVAAANGSLWGVAPPPPPTPPPAPALADMSIASAAIIEGHAGGKWLTFVASLSAAPTTPVTVSWATANGTARAGSDYVRGSGTMTFAAGQTEATLRVRVKGDRAREADETFRVELSNPINARLSATAATATGTIVNDDGRLRSALFAALAGPTTTKQRRR